jgi:SPOR domain
MNKSQLRRLAREYATGRLEHDQYLEQRSELIDAIVAGEIAIESSADSTADFAAARPRDRGIRGRPLPLIIGAGVVVAVIWAFLASRGTIVPGAGDQTAGRQVPAKPVSVARVLVEEFLATRDWSRESVAEFRDNWNALTPNEQAAARAAPWFRRLAEALREEINAHKALAEFDGSGLASTTGKRLEGFGEFLGIDAEMPDLYLPDRRAAIPTESDLREEPGGGQAVGPAPPLVYTLQVFASSSRENADRLVARYQALDLRVQVSDGETARYRVLYGRFDSPEAGREASARLPATLLEEVGKPLLREITEIN